MQTPISYKNGKQLLLLLGILFSVPAFAQLPQKEIIPLQQTWLGYFNQTRFNNKWGTWTDLHLRRTGNFVDQWSLGIARVGLTYYLSDRVRLTAGYAYVHHYPSASSPVAWPEHRPWQQIQWYQAYKGFSTMQWLRFEQRFRRQLSNGGLGEGYNFNYRIRYNFMLMVPLKGKVIEPKTPFLALNDELHINMGREIIYNYFDQNRAFIGLGYQFTRHLNAQLGYMNVFQQQAVGNRFNNTHAIRFFVFHTLDLRPHD
jgi:hypothetical protein